jgi:hypothetical protein
LRAGRSLYPQNVILDWRVLFLLALVVEAEEAPLNLLVVETHGRRSSTELETLVNGERSSIPRDPAARVCLPKLEATHSLTHPLRPPVKAVPLFLSKYAL